MLSPNKRKGTPVQNESPGKVIKDNPLLGVILNPSDRDTKGTHSITPGKQVEHLTTKDQNDNKLKTSNKDSQGNSQNELFWASQRSAQMLENGELKKKIANLKEENASLRSIHNIEVEKNKDLEVKCQEISRKFLFWHARCNSAFMFIQCILQSTSVFLQDGLVAGHSFDIYSGENQSRTDSPSTSINNVITTDPRYIPTHSRS